MKESERKNDPNLFLWTLRVKVLSIIIDPVETILNVQAVIRFDELEILGRSVII